MMVRVVVVKKKGMVMMTIMDQVERRDRLNKSQISSPCGFRHTVSVRTLRKKLNPL